MLMEQESNEGVAYLRALKQTPVAQAASAAAPARGAHFEGHSGTPGTEPRGAEKRRSPRYKCEGSAEIRREGSDVHTWAAFTDVSLHGCYVEAQATYPVGTILHIKLEANGARVEAKGNVRVSYPHLGMGIAFVEVPQETRTRLKHLLGSISHHSVIMGPGISSPLPICGPPDTVPQISDPRAAVHALVEFFEGHHMLTREDFLRLVQKSQG